MTAEGKKEDLALYGPCHTVHYMHCSLEQVPACYVNNHWLLSLMTYYHVVWHYMSMVRSTLNEIYI